MNSGECAGGQLESVGSKAVPEAEGPDRGTKDVIWGAGRECVVEGGGNRVRGVRSVDGREEYGVNTGACVEVSVLLSDDGCEKQAL